MNDSNLTQRGDAAWKAARDGVAERNEAASKSAREERKEHLANADRLRRAASAKRQARVKPEDQLG
jgi:hypothetical protein